MFKLAHLSDPHLGPLPAMRLHELAGKRALGYLNWVTGRKWIHLPEVLGQVIADIKRQRADHVAVTGDLINIALRSEFRQAADWLTSVGAPERVTLVPGNHDAYVPMAPAKGLDLWRAYMESNRAGKPYVPAGNPVFPFVRQLGEVALIGLSSAVPTLPLMASGRLGEKQRSALPELLDALGRARLFRIVLIHHPPLPGQAGPRRALEDADALSEILSRHGAELVLFGHNHSQSVDMLESASGPVPVVGVPSASCGTINPWPLARYNFFRIERRGRRWTCQMIGRGLNQPDGKIEKLEHIWLRA